MSGIVMTGRADLAVLGIGAATLDDLWLVPDFEAEEGVRQALAHVTMGGGPVSTALAVLACLGHRTSLVDVCGDDPAGNQVMQELQRLGVGTDHLQRHPGAITTQAVVQVRQSDGARQIVFLPCSAGEPIWSAALEDALLSARVLHLNGRHEHLARQAVQRVQQTDVVLSFDGGAGRYRDSIRDLVEACHLRVVSREFARCCTGESEIAGMMRALLTPPARWVVITDGSRGSYGSDDMGGVIHQPAHPVSRVVDTTGCGDVYHGAFLHGWLSGWELPRCMEFASRLAALNAEGLGGRSVCFSGCPSV